MTIKDLARESGYSLGTVSRVLNGHPNVSEKARRAVLAVVEARGFEINNNARNLKQSHGNGILVVVKGRGNELFSGVVAQYQELFSRTGRPLVIEFIDELDDEVHRAAALCREKKPQGVLFLGGNRENFRRGFDKIPVPAVLVTGSAEDLGFENLSSVTADDRKGGAAAAEYLLQCGHRDILVLGGDRQRSDTSRDRCHGFRQACADAGVPFDESSYVTCRFSYRSGYASMKQALDSGVACTAVFAMADVIAIGAIRAIREHGLQMPEDISVIGYDGLEIGDYLQPRLTTVVQPMETMAVVSARLLLEQIEQGAAARHEEANVCLQIRDSVQLRTV